MDPEECPFLLVLVHTKSGLTGSLTELGRARLDMRAIRQQQAEYAARGGGDEAAAAAPGFWVKIARRKTRRVVGKVFMHVNISEAAASV